REPYLQIHRDVMRRLLEAGRVEVYPEAILYAPRDNRFLTGCWLLGNCPNPDCGAGAAGSSCEVCGEHFPPYRMKDPYDRLGETHLERREVDNLLLKIDYDRVEDYVNRVQVAEDFRRMARRALKGRNFHARLATPGSWGVPWPRTGTASSSVLFTYSFNLAY